MSCTHLALKGNPRAECKLIAGTVSLASGVLISIKPWFVHCVHVFNNSWSDLGEATWAPAAQIPSANHDRRCSDDIIPSVFPEEQKEVEFSRPYLEDKLTSYMYQSLWFCKSSHVGTHITEELKPLNTNYILKSIAWYQPPGFCPQCEVCQSLSGKKVFYRKPEKWKKQSLKQDLYFGFGSKTA